MYLLYDVLITAKKLNNYLFDVLNTIQTIVLTVHSTFEPR
jgi:hypothetical protein